LLAHAEANARLSINPDHPGHLRVRVVHVSNLAEFNRSAIANGDDGFSELIEASELAGYADGDVGVPAFNCTGGQINIGFANAVQNLVEGDRERLDLLVIQIHLDFAFESAPDVCGSDAGNLFDAILNLLVDELPLVHRIQVAENAEDHDGERGDVEFP